jgi:hypothetical protein
MRARASSKRKPPYQGLDLRQRLAEEAARCMIEQGIADFGLAKRKAAERLGVKHRGALPSNSQIEACLAGRQRIFEPDVQPERLARLRQAAVVLMRALSLFSPRLVGPVLSGTATINAVIELHVFAPSVELVADVVSGLGRRPSACERKFRFGGGRTISVPGLQFSHASERAVVYVFGETGLREAPLSQVDRRPMRRAPIAQVEALIAG